MINWLKSLFYEKTLNENYKQPYEKELEELLKELDENKDRMKYARWLAGEPESRFLTMRSPLTWTEVENVYGGIDIKDEKSYYDLLDEFKQLTQIPEEFMYFVGDL